MSKRVIVPNVLGMHARAAARFARRAATFTATIKVACRGVSMDGKSIMGLLLLAAPKGSELEISADGPDEGEAMEALCTLVAQGFGELPSG